MKKAEEVRNEFIQEECEELFTKEPSILDTFYLVSNDEFILPEGKWLKGELESISLGRGFSKYEREFPQIRFTFTVKDKDSECSEIAVYTCRQDIALQRNQDLQRLLSALLGYIPRGNINLKELLIGKIATFKIKSYVTKDDKVTNYITEIK
ncbi:hypothetical protein KWV42_10400 [Clostridioides difficile]|uniref:hypothetical protein n=1 Tax=Clostridioides difficile TaxID=1496 RepID=UPI0010B7913D|nr:hypothetical protein [Clostridioides difficile]MBY1883496.1 hypothetical protein [Clostridioides difficile]MBZ0781385.1 hypothetical protein [Clostridioides difficile]MBZ0855029.1 hypothetical protein [Clostridioides difficile]MCG7701621.1 hypothetical protein [Clostridioides difficile]